MLVIGYVTECELCGGTNWGGMHQSASTMAAAGHSSTMGTRILTACVNTASALVLGCLLGNPLPAVESVLCSVQVFGEAQGLLYLTAMIQKIHTQSFAPQMGDFFVLCLCVFFFFNLYLKCYMSRTCMEAYGYHNPN